MRNIALPFTLLTVAVFSLPAVPAQAQARTFVSATGSDSNNCINVATPCRHLAAAYAASAEGGEIFVLDPANYGSLTVTGPISIEGHGWAAISPTSGNAAITINAGVGGIINITGVVLDGAAITNTTGIQYNSGGGLTVRDSVIRNFTHDGITFAPNNTSSTLNQLRVSNTLVSDNGGNGIAIGSMFPGTTIGDLDGVTMDNNGGGDGLHVMSLSQAINLTVSDSVSANNAGSGIVAASGGVPINVMVRNCTVANNGSIGLQAAAGPATLRVTRSTITGNGTGWSNIGLGVVLSYGDNNIDGNTNVNTEPPNPLTYK